MEQNSCHHGELPQYLLNIFHHLNVQNPGPAVNHVVPAHHLKTISNIPTPSEQHAQLLVRRHLLTERIAKYGLNPPLIYERGLVYEALGYADLAAADAFITYTLCDTVRSEEWVSDLEPVELSGDPWPTEDDQKKNLGTLCKALALLYRSLIDIGVYEDAEEKFHELKECYRDWQEIDADDEETVSRVREYLSTESTSVKSHSHSEDLHGTNVSRTGRARREIYPWNTYEPDRKSAESLHEINTNLMTIAPSLTAKITALPALNEDGSKSDEIWHQLGLFASENLSPGDKILKEKSLLTAIRPIDDALCDACGVDLETVSRDFMRQCPAEDCDTTFCSDDCADRAAKEYHKPNNHKDTEEDDDEDGDGQNIDSDYPPPWAPFCSNSALQEIGRVASTTTAEWDLYFLLLTRTIQMSTTQTMHPLSLPITKYLWGDFNPTVSITNPNPPPKRTLPWSLHHNLTLPLQYFETLMHSVPIARPYSAHWLANHDWWIQSTLLAKFRGVANAQQSTFDGKPEIAAVHPMWCLANHSCAPNVTWTPTGERIFRVRDGDEVVGREDGDLEWEGIREGEEIWSHYTDVRLPVEERRERLLEVLGGICRCERCVREAKHK